MQRSRIRRILLGGGVIMILVVAAWGVVLTRFSPLELVRLSHVTGNVPVGSAFDTALRRDLREFFEAKADPQAPVQALEYEMLRKRPTQSGVSLPKFHVRVRVTRQDGTLEEGAIRLAACEKRQFDVLQYLSRDTIRATPDLVGQIFPAPLVPGILTLAGVQ